MDDDDHDHDHDHDHEASDEPAANDGDSDDSSQQRARPETMGGDPVEEVRRKRQTLSRRYKIQEVVARRQIMLVQIGRAACRERACQYVEVAVVAGSIKKKKQTTVEIKNSMSTD